MPKVELTQEQREALNEKNRYPWIAVESDLQMFVEEQGVGHKPELSRMADWLLAGIDRLLRYNKGCYEGRLPDHRRGKDSVVFVRRWIRSEIRFVQEEAEAEAEWKDDEPPKGHPWGDDAVALIEAWIMQDPYTLWQLTQTTTEVAIDELRDMGALVLLGHEKTGGLQRTVEQDFDRALSRWCAHQGYPDFFVIKPM